MGTTTSSGADRGAWWSAHRKRFNLLLVAAAPISGVLLLLVWWLFEERLPCLEITGFTGLAGLVLFLIALGLANICYFLGPLSERLIRPRNVAVFRRYVFGSGLALSLLLVFVPPLGNLTAALLSLPCVDKFGTKHGTRRILSPEDLASELHSIRDTRLSLAPVAR